MSVIDMLRDSSQLSEWIAGTRAGQRQLVTGLAGSAKTLVMASLFQAKQNKVVIVTANLYQSTLLLEDLRNIFSDEELYTFPVNEISSVELAIASPEAMEERIRTLAFLASDQAGIVVLPAAGVRRFVPDPTIWKEASRTFTEGDIVDLPSYLEQLVQMGYRREAMVGSPGEFSIRGSILDIYPVTSQYPVRFDFFDDELDSLRYFEVDSQRSVEKITQVTILPASDIVVDSTMLQQAAGRMHEELIKHLAVLTDSELKEGYQNYFEHLISEWQSGNPTEQAPLFLDYLYERKYSVLDYLSGADDLIIDDYPRILELETEMKKDEAEWLTSKLATGTALPKQVINGDMREIMRGCLATTSFFSLFQKGMGHLKFQAIQTFQYRSMQQFFGQFGLLKVEMDRWQKQKYTVVILVGTLEKSQKLAEMLADHEINCLINGKTIVLPQTAQIMIGNLQTGLELPIERLAVITEKEILQTTTKKRARKQAVSNAERLKSYNELKPGDYVVHANHGIGRYVGMETLQVDGVHQDYLTILYQNNDKLFIPVTQLDLIQKYVASESKTPKINKLGGTQWSKTRQKVSAKIEDIADDLIQLYAEREAQQGFAFSPDDSYQQEFEEAFPYSETEDQLRSIQEIKRDMEKTRPMDRLLVGDVGYGKTEVALRAAFKAVQDGKQVAFLVPTTILAQQHYETMLERFAGFPVEIGILSRFSTKKQQNATIDGLKKGQVDIVVGTHRLLSKDVVFQDLGLLIIDEEQRFGVKHKERLKVLRAQVDVLTLTATPIPRTLHMSMLGVRDLSVIETPPANRYPVQTYVMEMNFGAIRDAVEREMARNGQVFYLYNRVETMSQKVAELQTLIPDARIGSAHGQMTEMQLENVLFEFINGVYDVLVTTTIIETGVDIPNVNTLFVENADYMGLSQLYQLRGRVGRSNRVAFAYFMYEQQKVLNEVSEKRLQAIKDFTELGSGFKIAMRDLSIRGAGNLLGAQQHGFIDSVGFDMYTQMLAEAVSRKQGKNPPESKTVVEIDLGIDAYIPSDYIQDERQKIEIYKRIRQLDSQEMYDELEEDILDRFGPYPDEVAYLLSIGLIKMNGDAALLDKIHKSSGSIQIVFSRKAMAIYQQKQIFKALSATSLKASVAIEEECLQVVLHVPKEMSIAKWLNELIQLISSLRQEKYLSVNAQQKVIQSKDKE